MHFCFLCAFVTELGHSSITMNFSCAMSSNGMCWLTHVVYVCTYIYKMMTTICL